MSRKEQIEALSVSLLNMSLSERYFSLKIHKQINTLSYSTLGKYINSTEFHLHIFPSPIIENIIVIKANIRCA